jgi:hypothetical protein
MEFQQVFESGSGPGGRRFKSSLPDQSFQRLKLRFCFSVYSDGVEIVDGACIVDFSKDSRLTNTNCFSFKEVP